MTPRKRFRPLLILPIAALVVMTLMVVPGNATLAKKYDLTVPTSVASGGSGVFVATYKNLSLYKLGSVELTLPTGFQKGTVTPSKGTIDPNTQTATTVRVTNLNLALLSTFKITVAATAPCGTLNGVWKSVGKSTNDFSGSANFALNNPGNAQKATVTGSCSLAFVPPQPADTGVGDIINDPTGVSVRALNGASQPVSGVPITMAENGPGSFTETSTTQVTTDGVPAVAPFTDLSVDAAGTYTLTASAAGYAPATSNQFVVAGAVLTCDETFPADAIVEEGDAADNVDLTRQPGACGTPIPITVVVRADEVEVQKENVPESAFRMTIDWVVEDAVNPVPATGIDYNDGEGFHPMQFCLADDNDDGNPDLPPRNDGADGNEFWCITNQTVTLFETGPNAGQLQLTESYFGAGDPKFARNK